MVSEENAKKSNSENSEVALNMYLPVKGEVFAFDNHTAFLILPPEIKKQPIPWVWYAPLVVDVPGIEEKWMFEQFLDAGIALAGVDIGESYGSPQGRSIFSAFYQYLVNNHGLATKACLYARSRGGLMQYNWAAENPSAVKCIAGIYPVCDMRTYPGLKEACGAYGLTEKQLEAQLEQHNPIDRLEKIAQAKVDIFHIHGDVDSVVPLEENSLELARRYKILGGDIQIQIAEGQGHNYWYGFFKCQKLIDFIIAHT